MQHLKAGNQFFHNRVPIELLYRIYKNQEHEVWRCKKLFAADEQEDRTFTQSDTIGYFHGGRRIQWGFYTETAALVASRNELASTNPNTKKLPARLNRTGAR